MFSAQTLYSARHPFHIHISFVYPMAKVCYRGGIPAFVILHYDSCEYIYHTFNMYDIIMVTEKYLMAI